MAEVMYMTGARGGSGVTTCAVNLAAALSAGGARPVAVLTSAGAVVDASL